MTRDSWHWRGFQDFNLVKVKEQQYISKSDWCEAWRTTSRWWGSHAFTTLVSFAINGLRFGRCYLRRCCSASCRCSKLGRQRIHCGVSKWLLMGCLSSGLLYACRVELHKCCWIGRLVTCYRIPSFWSAFAAICFFWLLLFSFQS